MANCTPGMATELPGSDVQCATLQVRECLTVDGVEITGGGGTTTEAMPGETPAAAAEGETANAHGPQCDGLHRGERVVIIMNGFSSQPTSIGFPSSTLAPNGTTIATARAADGSALYGRARMSYVSASALNSIGGYYVTSTQGTVAMRGNAPGGPGFKFSMGFGVCDISDGYSPTGRLFAGLTQSALVPADVDPSTLLTVIGVGADSGQANLSVLIHGNTPAPGVDLGAGFPVGVAGVPELYRFAVYCRPGNETPIEWRLDRVRTGTFVTGVASGPFDFNPGAGFFDRLVRSSGDAAVLRVSAVAFWGARIERSGFQP